MTLESILTLTGLIAIIIGLYSNRGRPAYWFVTVAVVLYLTGVLTLPEVLTGLTNEGVVTLALLMVIAFLVQDSGLLEKPIEAMLNRANRNGAGFIGILAPVALVSGFLNNTPIVSMLVHPIRQWALDRGMAPSQFLMPLSYAAIVGGTLTLIGTSTNLVVFGLVKDMELDHSLHLLSPAWVGLPLTVLFLIYYWFARHRLPKRTPADTRSQTVTHFQIPARVTDAIAGQSVQDAELRNLKHGYLYRLVRATNEVLEVDSQTRLHTGDQLVFLGAPQLVKELSHIKGVEFSNHDTLEGAEPTHLVEAVVPMGSSLIGKTAKEVGFRKRFGSVIVSIAHQTEQRFGKLGQYTLKAGDLLLLETQNDHKTRIAASDLMVLNRYHSAQPPQSRRRSYLTLLAFPAMVLLGSALGFPLLDIALVFIALALLTGLARASQLPKGIELELFAILVGALALARAVDKTGLADAVVGLLHGLPMTPLWALAAIFLITWLMTELLTNNSAAALMLPFALPIGALYGLSVNQVAITVMIAASASFVTPFGYQTNLMVLSAGNYKPIDYVKFGFPLVVISAVTTVMIVYLLM